MGCGCVEVYEFTYWEVPDYGRYNVQAGYVQLPEGFTLISASAFVVKAKIEKDFKHALLYCGFVCAVEGIENEHDGELVCAWGDKHLPFILAECAWAYGQKDVALDVSGNNRAKLIRAARRAL
jgi:hypothetical protein